MKLADLSPTVLRCVRKLRWDRIIEKHEGPESWDAEFEYGDPEFIRLAGFDVLLPVNKKQHRNISLLRCIVGDSGRSLTLFLKDTTYSHSPDDPVFDAGFIAVCDRFPGKEFFVAIVYHEWFIIKEQVELQRGKRKAAAKRKEKRLV
jgi:hypothetical protein